MQLASFNDLTELQLDEINHLLELSKRLVNTPEPRSLEGKVLSLLFLNRSLRTLASFQAAMSRLGGDTVVISPEMSIHGLESRSGIVMDGVAAEHIREAVPVIAGYGDVFGLRAFAKQENLAHDLQDNDFKELIQLSGRPYINMESAISHPCQSLADWKTLDEIDIPRNGGKIVVSWVYHPDPLPYAVPASTILMAAMRGMDITLLRPEGYGLPASIMEKASRLAQASGGSLSESSDSSEAMEGAHVIYATSWGAVQNYGDKKAEDTQKRGISMASWCVDESWFARARSDCRFMHSSPVRRGVEVVDEILDGPRSLIQAEAHNRMLVQMAVLHNMLVG